MENGTSVTDALESRMDAEAATSAMRRMSTGTSTRRATSMGTCSCWSMVRDKSLRSEIPNPQPAHVRTGCWSQSTRRDGDAARSCPQAGQGLAIGRAVEAEARFRRAGSMSAIGENMNVMMTGPQGVREVRIVRPVHSRVV